MPDAFWIVFDVGQVPQYYRDVHNLLALPVGTTIRYDYRREYLCEAAVDRAERCPTEQLPVLLLYEQRATPYLRDRGRSRPQDMGTPSVYVTTRLATMLNITQDGDSFYFDLEVTSYPNQDQAALNELITVLQANGNYPWADAKDGFPVGRFVCLSTLMRLHAQLSAGDEHQNWVAIVDTMARPPMQFSGDAFWRLKGPFPKWGDQRSEPDIDYHQEEGRTRQAQARYDFAENTVWRFELVSEAGRQIENRPEYECEIKTSDDTVLKFLGTPLYRLRHYTGQMVEFKTQNARLFGQGGGALVFGTRPQPTEWPAGPSFSLPFSIRKHRGRVSVGVLLGVAGVATFVLGDSALLDEAPLWAALLKFVGILLCVGATLFLTGKLMFEPK